MPTVDKQIDQIFNEIDDLCLAGKFSDVDEILAKVNVEDHSTSILIAYLTITLPFMKKWHMENTGHISQAREKLFHQIHDKLKRDETDPNRIERLLSGLGLFTYTGNDANS